MKINIAFQWTIFALSLLILVPGLVHLPLFDWDEANFAEISREMICTGNYLNPQIGFDPFYEKPPLFFWIQAGSMKLFGIGEFAARLPNAIFGALSLLLLYRIGSREKGHFFGIIWVLFYSGSMAFLYFKSGIIDPGFNYFILLILYYLFKEESESHKGQNGRIEALLVGIFAGLACLMKGPVALLIIFTIWFLRLLLSNLNSRRFISLGLLSLLGLIMILAIWLIPLLGNGNHVFLTKFIEYQWELVGGQIEWHNQPWYYHILVLLLISFPASIFCWPYLFKRYGRAIPEWDYYMASFFWVVLILFSIVTTKIIHYSSLCWFPITYFAAQYGYNKYTFREVNKNRYLAWGILIIGTIISIILMVLPIILGTPELKQMLVIELGQEFAIEQINTDVNWPYAISVIGLTLFIITIFGFWTQIVKTRKSMWLEITAVCFFVWLAIYLFILPRIAEHTQSTMVQKMKDIEAKNGLQINLNYKSYTPLFYGKLKLSEKTLKKSNGEIINYKLPEKTMWDWATDVSSRKINRDFYLWTKTGNNAKLDKTWKKEGIYNGYVLYRKQF